MKILAVDDNPVDRTIMANFIEKAMYPEDELLVAGSGAEAIEKIRDASVELVLTDLMMPDFSGMDVLVESKRANPWTEVIVITSSQSVESAVDAMKKGARDYLTKPIHAEVLGEKINHIRDYLSLVEKVDDCRVARDILANAVTHDMRTLEVYCTSLNNILREIENVLCSRDDDKEKVLLIGELVECFRYDKKKD